MTNRIIARILPKEDTPFGVVGWLELQIAKYPKKTRTLAPMIGNMICILFTSLNVQGKLALSILMTHRKLP
jgi:hypothetical protein